MQTDINPEFNLYSAREFCLRSVCFLFVFCLRVLSCPSVKTTPVICTRMTRMALSAEDHRSMQQLLLHRVICTRMTRMALSAGEVKKVDGAITAVVK